MEITKEVTSWEIRYTWDKIQACGAQRKKMIPHGHSKDETVSQALRSVNGEKKILKECGCPCCLGCISSTLPLHFHSCDQRAI